jgi:dolichyl-phosphate beta-glucosyltransferase
VAGETSPQLGRPYLSVVIPAYNEAERLARTLTTILDYLEREGIRAELLVVDDGSVDGSTAVAGELLAGRRGRVLRNPENRGKGYSVRRGFLESEGRWVLMTDADLSAPIEEHARLAAAARDHDLDLVIGSRALPDSNVEVHQNPVRELMGKSFNRVIRLTTGLPFRDTQCGFKLMDRDRVRPLFERMVIDGFAFDVELLFLAVRFGLAVREVPVTWRNAPDSKVSLVADPLRMLADLARIRWRFRRGGYNPQREPAAEPVRGADR